MGTDSVGLGRRTFLRATATGLGMVAVGSPLLSACGGSNSAAAGKANDTASLKAVLPKYVPLTNGPKPDVASVAGGGGSLSDPGFLSYPTDLVKTVEGVPGKGGTYTAVTPLWGSIPAADNPYYQAVNKALGANVQIKPANGNDYGTTIPTLVAGGKLPDWIQLPTWWNGTFNTGELVATKFADLTPYLAGDKITKYPNLAAIPTGGWQDGAWNNKLYGLPSFTSGFSVAGLLNFRKDVLDAKGIDPASVKDADSLLALGKELTSAANNIWAFEVLWLAIQQIFKVPMSSVSPVVVVDGKAASVFETPEFLAALEFAYTMAKSGYVHPDALANKTNEAKARFYAGHTLVTADGQGAWNGGDAKEGRAANPKYFRDAFPLFSHDGSAPTIALRSSSAIVSYLNKNLSAAQIEECLAIANYLAAPYGSEEYTLINFGVKGVHWNPGANGPVQTTQGSKEANTSTYQFLCAPQSAVTNPGFEDVTKAYCAWHAANAKYAIKPAFLNINITTPARFATASTAQAVNDLITQTTYGTKTVADVKTAAANWKTSGGQALIDWVQKSVIDVQGTGQ